ncbi:MAG: DUF4325 domain-containing protein [Armatimonadetes bacterium]|nr:MAG: DUF4325 domain-containing protein [Armatimonadota bacterium]
MSWYIEFSGPKFGYMDYVYFLRQLDSARLSGETRLEVDFGKVTFFYPDGMAPFVATTRHLVNNGWGVGVIPPRQKDLIDYWQTVGWLAGIRDEKAPLGTGSTYVPLTPYTSGEELNSFIRSALDLMSKSQAFSDGVLLAFEWALNEIADNVLVHAESSEPGWLQMTSYPNKNEVEFVVVDTGRGIRSTLSPAFPDIDSDIGALMKAIEKGTTRNREIGQGNGLSGTLRIARSAGGWANLHSGRGLLRLMEGEPQSGEDAPHQGVVVTLTLPTSQPIDIAEALWGHVPVPAFEMEYLGDHGIEFTLGAEATNFGNRSTGERLRFKLRNIMAQHPDEPVIVDFQGVDLMSASFADEFIAKLVKELGYVAFFGRFRFRHLSEFSAQTLDTVIGQRMSV